MPRIDARIGDSFQATKRARPEPKPGSAHSWSQRSPAAHHAARRGMSAGPTAQRGSNALETRWDRCKAVWAPQDGSSESNRLSEVPRPMRHSRPQLWLNHAGPRHLSCRFATVHASPVHHAREQKLASKIEETPANEGLSVSRPVSRILSWMAIHLGPRFPGGSSGAPGPSAGHLSGTCFALHRTGFGEPPCHHGAGGLLPHRFTLTGIWMPAVSSLFHFPSAFAAWDFPSALPCGVRTFLGRPKPPAATRPARESVRRPGRA